MPVFPLKCRFGCVVPAGSHISASLDQPDCSRIVGYTSINPDEAKIEGGNGSVARHTPQPTYRLRWVHQWHGPPVFKSAGK